MYRKRTKIDNERVLSDLSRNLNEEQLHLQKNVKPHNKLRGTYGEFKDFFQKCREYEVLKKEKLMQKHLMIEEEKRELATNQLQVMNLVENEAVYHIHPDEQHDALDHTLESKKVQLKEVLANVDSMQDELTALMEEYEMMKIECANQITRARDMKLDAERKLKNLEMRVRDKKSDLESLIESEKIENERIEKIYRERGRVSASLGDDYVLLFHIGLTSDPTRPKEEQIEESLIPLRTRCREILDDAKADFEQRCKKDRTTQEELAIEMEDTAPKTSREWKMEHANYPEGKSHSMQIRRFQESSLSKLDLGNMNWMQASKFCEDIPDNNPYGITVHMTTNRIVKRVTLVKNELEIWKPSPNAM